MADLAWRKFPVNTIRNENLDYISFMLPKELATAPYMFYMTAVCTCDDDGVFDIEDGVIYARMMKTGTPADVFNIARLMCERKIIAKIVANENKFMITDWEAPERRNTVRAKTAEERRAIIAQKILAEQKQKAINQQTAPELYPFPTACNPSPSEPAESMPDFDKLRAMRTQNDAFFCALNDKNTKNVANTEREERETDTQRDKQTETREENTESRDKETHTQREGCKPTGLEGPYGFPPEEIRAEPRPERPTEDKVRPEESPLQSEIYVPESNETAVSEKVDEGMTDNGELAELAVSFFVQKSMLFRKEYDMHKILELCKRVRELATEKNPAKVIMKTILKQFDIIHANVGSYYHDCPLTPQFLLKHETWAHVLTKVSGILLNSEDNKSRWTEQIERDPAEAEAIEADVTAECIKYGIDPESPSRLAELVLAKASLSASPQDTG